MSEAARDRRDGEERDLPFMRCSTSTRSRAVMEASAVFGRRWFLALALRQVPRPEDITPPPEAEPVTDDIDECAS